MKTSVKKLQNPFALVGQGFLVGGAAVLATRADAARASSPRSSELA